MCSYVSNHSSIVNLTYDLTYFYKFLNDDMSVREEIFEKYKMLETLFLIV